MRTITITPDMSTVHLGRQGENYALQIRFPKLDWAESYGENGELQILHRRSGDSYPYTVTTTQDENYLYWNVDRIDTASNGVGHAEVLYLVGGAVAKSKIYVTRVDAALGDAGAARYVDVSREGA